MAASKRVTTGRRAAPAKPARKKSTRTKAPAKAAKSTARTKAAKSAAVAKPAIGAHAATPAATATPTPTAAIAKPAKTAAPARKPKRVRVDFAMPEGDYARIARLKAAAKRTGLKVRKNELFRLGLQQLQSLPADELHALVMTLRRTSP